MSDLLLVNPRYRVLEEPIQEHLGFGYIASFLRSKGYSVDIIDAGIRAMSTKRLAREIMSRDFKLLGVAVIYQAAVREQLSIIPVLRDAGLTAHITVGGYFPTLAHRELLGWRTDVDSIVRGEGEYTALGLLECLGSSGSLDHVEGLTFRNDGVVVENELRPLIDDLDSLPFPARDELPQAFERGGCITVVTSRGCYAACKYCSIRSFYDCMPGANWRGRSPENVLDELEEVVKRFGKRKVKFEDANLFGPGTKGRERVIRLAEGMIERNLGLTFRFECRAENVDHHVFSLLKRAGLEEVFIGIESFVPRVLDDMNKGSTVDENLRALEVLARLGIRAGLGFIAFDPDTTLDEFFTNLEMVKKHIFPLKKALGFYLDPLGRLQVFAGTQIHQELVQRGAADGSIFRDDFVFSDRSTRIFYTCIQPLKNSVHGVKRWLKRHGLMKRREF
jgi:anaerobic magnesium-protoporphyrin IX monomethyl ester cyclase